MAAMLSKQGMKSGLLSTHSGRVSTCGHDALSHKHASESRKRSESGQIKGSTLAEAVFKGGWCVKDFFVKSGWRMEDSSAGAHLHRQIWMWALAPGQ